MIRIIVLLAFVVFFAVTPVYLLDTQVLPELSGLKDAYGNAETTANQVLQK